MLRLKFKTPHVCTQMSALKFLLRVCVLGLIFNATNATANDITCTLKGKKSYSRIKYPVLDIMITPGVNENKKTYKSFLYSHLEDYKNIYNERVQQYGNWWWSTPAHNYTLEIFRDAAESGTLKLTDFDSSIPSGANLPSFLSGRWSVRCRD